jgi:hypothetical protein
MDGKKRYTRKQLCKLANNKCFFCHEDKFHVLDAHRIIPGEQGGTYIPHNILVLCANCHRRVHAGEIKIDRKYPTTGKSLWVLHCWIEGQELWLSDNSFSSENLTKEIKRFTPKDLI